MYTEEEIKQDMGKLRDHVEALRLKYGENFSSVVAAGVENDEYFIGICMIGGNPGGMHQSCHAMLNCVNFINNFFDACKCVLHDDEKPEMIQKLEEMNLESLKKLLIMRTDEFKKVKAEHEAEKAVQDLLKQAGFTN